MLPEDSGPKLHLLVSDSSRELCRVTLPLSAIDNLEHLFPDQDLAQVKAVGVDFPEVVARARRTNYEAQTLIDTQSRERSYRIWIA